MGILNKKYKCNSCGHVFDESDAKWVDIDFEGKDTIDNDSVMDSLPLCPKCGSDNLSEYYEEDNNSKVNNKSDTVLEVFEQVIKIAFLLIVIVGGGYMIFGTMKALLAFIVVMFFLTLLTK